MTHKLTTITLWLTADPNRLRLILVGTFFVLTVMGALLPGVAVLADGGTGGSHVP